MKSEKSRPRDYRPVHILSKNKKTGASIDLPREGHCRPTKVCSQACYARQGHQTRPDALKKQKYISEYLKNDIKELIEECRGITAVRLNGCGDLLQEHIPAILSLAKQSPQTEFWGMTRKPEIAMAINNKLPNLRLLVTVDATSPKTVWNYKGGMCFGPRRKTDPVPDDPRIKVVFPRHHAGRVIKGVPEHPKDCQGVYHRISGCLACGRCWTWESGTDSKPPSGGHQARKKLSGSLGDLEYLFAGTRRPARAKSLWG